MRNLKLVMEKSSIIIMKDNADECVTMLITCVVNIYLIFHIHVNQKKQ